MSRPPSLRTIRHVRVDLDNVPLCFRILIFGYFVNGVVRERNGNEVRIGVGVDD